MLADFLVNPTRRMLKAFNVIKKSKPRKNSVCPLLCCPIGGAVDASREIDERFSASRKSQNPATKVAIEDTKSNDSAYDSESPEFDSHKTGLSIEKCPVVVYFVDDKEDTYSITTECTVVGSIFELDSRWDDDETTQNSINENIENNK